MKKKTLLTFLLSTATASCIGSLLVNSQTTISNSTKSFANNGINKKNIDAKLIGAKKGEITIEYSDVDHCKIASSSHGFVATGDFNFNGGHFTIDGVTYTITEIAKNAFHPGFLNWKFEYCNLTIPSTIKKIGKNAFTDNEGSNKELLSFKFEEGVEEIGEGAFAGCTNNDNYDIVLPSTIKKIGKNAFAGASIRCIDLTKVDHVIDWDNPTSNFDYKFENFIFKNNEIRQMYMNNSQWSSISKKLLVVDGELITRTVQAYYINGDEGHATIQYVNKNDCKVIKVDDDFLAKSKDLNFYNGKIAYQNGYEFIITSIGDYAFSNPEQKHIDKARLVIPGSVKTIGKHAFWLKNDDTLWYETNTYSELIIQNGVEDIGEGAFGDNYKLDKEKPVVIPNSVKHIGNDAFYNMGSQYLDLRKVDHVIKIDCNPYDKEQGCLRAKYDKDEGKWRKNPKVLVKSAEMKAKYCSDPYWSKIADDIIVA